MKAKKIKFNPEKEQFSYRVGHAGVECDFFTQSRAFENTQFQNEKNKKGHRGYEGHVLDKERKKLQKSVGGQL